MIKYRRQLIKYGEAAEVYIFPVTESGRAGKGSRFITARLMAINAPKYSIFITAAIRVFEADKIIIVTQQYHLYRAMYIAKAAGLEVHGVAADYRSYSGQFSRDVREVLARIKDFGMTIFWPEPTYLGEAIPISGNGNLTNDDTNDFT